MFEQGRHSYAQVTIDHLGIGCEVNSQTRTHRDEPLYCAIIINEISNEHLQEWDGGCPYVARITDNGGHGDGCWLVVHDKTTEHNAIFEAMIPNDAIPMWIAALQAVADCRRAAGYPVDDKKTGDAKP